MGSISGAGANKNLEAENVNIILNFQGLRFATQEDKVGREIVWRVVYALYKL